MSLKEIIDSMGTDDFVDEFKNALKDTGVEMAEDPVAKYFVAKTEDATLFLLAHESNLSKGWWGIHHDIVDRVINLNQQELIILGGEPSFSIKLFSVGIGSRGITSCA